MNRIMVVWGFGSLLLFTSFAHSEMPTLVRSTDTPEPKAVWHTNFQNGWKESRERGVPMVIYITSDHCQYCEAMKRDTWCDDSIRNLLSDEFVAIRLTPAENSATLSRIKINTYPTTLIGVPEGKIVEHRVGYQPAAVVHGLLTQVRERRLLHRDGGVSGNFLRGDRPRVSDRATILRRNQ